MVLAQLLHRIDHAAAHQAEVADIGWQRHFAEIVHDAVERRGGGLLQPAIAGAQAALRIDHVVAGAPGSDETRDHLGRVLQVGVDHDHRVALGMVEPGGGGDLLAEIARQVDDGDVAVGLLQQLDDAQRGVAAAVVDVDGFPWRAQRRHHGSEAAVHRADDLGLIVDRYDYREDRPAARLHVHWR